MRIVNLASGSKGNSTFVGYNQSKILIDVGLSEREIKRPKIKMRTKGGPLWRKKYGISVLVPNAPK